MTNELTIVAPEGTPFIDWEREFDAPIAAVFAALADPTRRDLVARLAMGDATVGELAAPYAVSVQAVSKHLQVLERAGLVTKGRDAQRRPVHLNSAELERLTAWIDRYRIVTERQFRNLDALLATKNGTSPGAGKEQEK